MAGKIKFRKGSTTYSLVGDIYQQYLYPTFNDTVANLRVYYDKGQGEGDYDHSNNYGSTNQGTKVLVGTSDAFGRIYIDNSSPTVHFRKEGKTYHCAKSWWIVSKNYVMYYPNGGSGSMDSQSFWSEDGEKVTIKANSFTRTGYTFSKWNTSENGSGTSYSPGASVSTSLNLYAIWVINTYSIVYKANGGTGSDVTQSFNYGTSVTTKGAIFTRANYTLTKWNTASNGGGTDYSLSTSQGAINKSLTLYAIWKRTYSLLSVVAHSTSTTSQQNSGYYYKTATLNYVIFVSETGLNAGKFQVSYSIPATQGLVFSTETSGTSSSTTSSGSSSYSYDVKIKASGGNGGATITVNFTVKDVYNDKTLYTTSVALDGPWTYSTGGGGSSSGEES